MSLMESPPRQSAAIVRCTEDVPPRLRRDYWNDTISVPFPGIAVDWSSSVPIYAQLKSRAFADARVTEIVNTPGRVTYTPPLSSTRNDYLLVLELAGSERYTQANHEIVQEPNDLILLDAAQPFEAEFPQGLHILVWHLPREMVAPLLAAPERAACAHIAGDHGLGAVLAGYARSLVGEVGRFEAARCRCCRREAPMPAEDASQFDAITQRSLELHLCSLAALALGASEEAWEMRHAGYRTARRQQILTYVEAHLRQADLTVARAARDLKMSSRWLHALLADHETSFAALVARRRVEECHKRLQDPTRDHLSITEIALRSGFNDLSTFNRRFLAHYGMTPREVRRARMSTGKGVDLGARPLRGGAHGSS
ncbi:helix-turn-helix domain-containing protein [Mesorhizobium sp. ES1-3]|uniref:helix-turn-helix domain-containing protein n=1 Tax=Mesorhizobium sp. ES1-3 TaxID=2876628 RepID=UPI001CCF39DB|nr:helix-turn-helix domain-containing protein [Mesorhizobium sp. ES1-3]MBZ9674035.1 helix-turn-helix domain-containing protein [Mesorhizobium sp. ES1-3]